jgi:DNA-binding NarL/FixJ family response regulator
LTNDELATKMGISTGTVKTYLARIFCTIGVTNRLELALWGLAHLELLRGVPESLKPAV